MKEKKVTRINFWMFRMIFLSAFVLSSLVATAQGSKEYTDAQVTDFATDLAAGTYDTLILATSGGIYDVNYVRIYQTTVIMGKEGLENKPVLTNTANTSGSAAIFSIRDAGVRDTITFHNLEFDGSGATAAPSLLRSLADHHIVVKDCYIHDVTNSGGVLRIDGPGSSVDMQNTIVLNSRQRVIGLTNNSGVYGDINVKNCTFGGITSGYVIHFRSSGGVFAAGNNVTVDHCTFSDIAADPTYYHPDSIHGTFSITNSIFDQVGGKLMSEVLDYNYVAGIETAPDNATNSITTDPVFADASLGNYTLINKDEMTGGDLQILGDLSWYDDEFPPIVYEDLIKVDPSHVMVQFNEIVEEVSATTAANYTLSGTAGLTGNPTEVILDQNGKDALLTVSDLSGMEIGQNVIVTVSNVVDLAGNMVEAGSDVATYTLLDEVSPLITMEAQSVNNDPGQSVAAQSNELGVIYLVHSDAAQSSVEDFLTAIESGHGSSEDVTTIDVDVSISTQALKVGNYSAYAVDTSGNISVKSTNEAIVSDVTAPEITMVAQEVSNSKIDVVFAQSNETGMIYLILEGEAQSTVSDFEAAIAAGKGSSANSVTANEEISASTFNLEPGTYYSYAVDDVGNISSKSANAAIVNKFEPRIRHYAAADALQMEIDIKNALDGDVFILTESGGDYITSDRINIGAKITIMADEGLEKKPVIWNNKETGTPQVLLFNYPDLGLTLKGVELKGNPDPAWPTAYLIRANVGNYYLVAEDCYFNGVDLKTKGAIFRNYAGTQGDSIIFRDCIFEAGEEALSSTSGAPGFDMIEITNCTFFDYTENVIFMSYDQALNGDAPIDIDHCTFNNAGGVDDRIFNLDNNHHVSVTNSILANTTADTTWHMYGDAVNKSTMDFTNLHICPPPLEDMGGLLGSNMFDLDPMFADADNGDFTLGNTALLDMGSDGLPLGDLRWADIFGPTVKEKMTARSDSTLLLEFNEWIDTASAELVGNYELSGSAGYTGNVKNAELFNFYSVLLTVESFTSQVGNEIIVTVSNVEDLKGNVVDPDHNTASYIVEEFRPVVTANTQDVTNGDGQVVIAQSNQGTGFVYVILDGEPQSSIAELDAAVDAKKGAKAPVSEAYTDTEIDVYGVDPGVYYAYATDGVEQISEKGLNVITITDGIAPVVTYDVQGATNGPEDVVLVQSNEPGDVYIILDGENQETVNDFVSAIFAGKGSTSEVAVVDTDVEVSTKDLAVGIYYAYAVDEAGNISTRGANPLNISQTTVSIEEFGQTSVKVYSYNMKLVIEANPSEVERMLIFDITGRKVIDTKLVEDRHEFQMEEEGFYLIRILSKNNEVLSFKQIVK